MAIGVGIGVVRLNGSDAVGMGDYYKRTIQEQFEREAGQYEGAVANSGYETYIALADSLGVAEENRWDEARFNAAAAEGRAETVKIRDENDEMMAADATNALYAAYADMGVTVKMPELWDNFRNLHPTGQPIWSFMFITVACGALSGFHATQSPMMARCLKSERQGRFVFSGAMTAEGIIAMVWAAAGCTFFGSSGLNNLFANVTKLTDGRLGAGNGTTVYNISVLTMGGFGAIIAMLGVIACPITSGDTAFRSARLTLADWFKIDQGDTKKRLMLTIPVLGVGAFLAFGNTFGFVDYEVIWRYFAWTNQTLAMIVLWAAAMYLAKEKKNFWICALPATFMSAVSITYFCMAGETLGMIEFFKNNTSVAYPAGIIAAAAFFGLFWWKSGKYRKAEATA
ncbi:MAG: carbon starvation protein A [Lachnospiraceae bacterium]|nr:carbon starvation protein A [Lachnospiraceae bacterium]